MDWCILEARERLTPGMLVGSDEPGSLFSSPPNKSYWRQDAQLVGGSILGAVVDWPVVQLFNGGLRSERDLGVAQNLMYVCGEWIQFKRAKLLKDKCYRLSEISTGLRGSEARDHIAGEQICMVDDSLSFVPSRAAELGESRIWRLGDEHAMAVEFHPSYFTLPRLDGKAAWSEPVEEWGQRWRNEETSPIVYTWLDRWVEFEVEVGHRLFLQDEERTVVWDGEFWRSE